MCLHAHECMRVYIHRNKKKRLTRRLKSKIVDCWVSYMHAFLWASLWGVGGKHMTGTLKEGDLSNTTFYFIHSEIILG